MRTLVLVGLLALTLFPASYPTTQTAVGTVSGTVKDPAGATIPGARVELSSPGLTSLIRITDVNGAFRFERVPVAKYDVTATLTGFATYKSRVTVAPNATVQLVVVLRLSSAAETVTVTAEAPRMGGFQSIIVDSLGARSMAPAASPAPWPMPYG